jgi:hypothetical protein
MGEKIRGHIRSNVIGYVALFIALTGTAYANHGFPDTISSEDIIDREVKTPDLALDSVGTGRIIDGGVRSADVLDNDLTGGDVANTDSLRSPEIGGLTGADVTDQSLTGADVLESTLTALDGHDSFAGECDPHSTTFIVCDELNFTLGRAMEISATFVYGFGTDGEVKPWGTCQTTLDGTPKDTDVSLRSEDDEDNSLGGTPIVDVMSLSAGSHTVGLECREDVPIDGRDFVARDIGISVVELGFD